MLVVGDGVEGGGWRWQWGGRVVKLSQCLLKLQKFGLKRTTLSQKVNTPPVYDPPPHSRLRRLVKPRNDVQHVGVDSIFSVETPHKIDVAVRGLVMQQRQHPPPSHRVDNSRRIRRICKRVLCGSTRRGGGSDLASSEERDRRTSAPPLQRVEGGGGGVVPALIFARAEIVFLELVVAHKLGVMRHLLSRRACGDVAKINSEARLVKIGAGAAAEEGVVDGVATARADGAHSGEMVVEPIVV
jgi:hypothetical protein